MAAKTAMDVQENPLVPHAVLLRMYAVMQQIRRTEGKDGRGEEACRASSLLSLETADLLSDLPARQPARRSGRRKGAPVELQGVLRLEAAGDAEQRLLLAMGAAGALRAQVAGRLVLAYARAEELSPAKWQRVLGLAGEGQLPIIFFLLPSADAKRQGVVSDRAQSWGVPGMPVDAADAVALYRVMQESVGRARGGDGPALLEAIAWRLPGKESPEADGLDALRRLLKSKGLRASKGVETGRGGRG